MRHILIKAESYREFLALSPIADRLLFYMAFDMDQDNNLSLTVDVKNRFMLDMTECGKRISLQSIHNAISELKKSGLIKEVARSTYKVSKKHFSKVSGATVSAPINATE